jgi:hypothetical protein
MFFQELGRRWEKFKNNRALSKKEKFPGPVHKVDMNVLSGVTGHRLHRKRWRIGPFLRGGGDGKALALGHRA